jgi:hypothetical protein
VIAISTVALACGVLAGAGAHWTAGLRQDKLSQVTATITEPAAGNGSHPATGRWTAPDGTPRTGTILAPPGRPAGAQVPVWLDQAGQVTAAPTAGFYRIARPFLAGAAVTSAILLLTRHPLRHRDQIDIEWRRVSHTWRRDYLLALRRQVLLAHRDLPAAQLPVAGERAGRRASAARAARDNRERLARSKPGEEPRR